MFLPQTFRRPLLAQSLHRKTKQMSLKMSERIFGKSKLDFLAHHKTVYVVLPRNEANDYLLAHKFTEPEKNLLKKLRRNHQNKVCAQNYRLGFRVKIESLENTIIQLKAQLLAQKEEAATRTLASSPLDKKQQQLQQQQQQQQQLQQHLHWKKKIMSRKEKKSQVVA
jgi:hypothetical protein